MQSDSPQIHGGLVEGQRLSQNRGEQAAKHVLRRRPLRSARLQEGVQRVLRRFGWSKMGRRKKGGEEGPQRNQFGKSVNKAKKAVGAPQQTPGTLPYRK